MSTPFPGHPIKIGGRELILPPLNLRLYYSEDGETPCKEVLVVQNPTAHKPEEYNAAAAKLLKASLRRNYSPEELPQEFLLDNVNVCDLPTYVFALLTNAGFKKSGPLDSQTKAGASGPEQTS